VVSGIAAGALHYYVRDLLRSRQERGVGGPRQCLRAWRPDGNCLPQIGQDVGIPRAAPPARCSFLASFASIVAKPLGTRTRPPRRPSSTAAAFFRGNAKPPNL